MKNTTVRGIFSDMKKLNMKQKQEIKELKDEISFLNRKINNSIKSELLLSDTLDSCIDLNKFKTVLTTRKLLAAIFNDFFK